MPAVLTAIETGPPGAAYGLECPEHPEARRRNLAQPHALNAVAKHNRDHHPEPGATVYRVGALATLVQESWEAWMLAIADGLDDPEVAHKATPHQRRFLILREAWMTLLGLEAGDPDTAPGVREAAAENHHAVRPTF